MMTKQIIDINRYGISSMTMFHFQHSLRPFIMTYTTNDEPLFIDLTNSVAYNYDELENVDLYFYTKDDDEDYHGVEIIGDIPY